MTDYRFVRFDDHPNVGVTSSRVHPFAQARARRAIHRAADRTSLWVTSAFRTLVEQYVLYHSGACGLAAPPGSSNHQSGRAIDASNWSSARGALEAAGCNWFGSADAVHFDCPGGDRRSDAIRAFQRLWNINHPRDRIAEDGNYGTATAVRLGNSPAGGFPRGGCCRARCDGNVVVRSNCSRTRCGAVKACIVSGGRPRCIDPECPADGSRATLCASDGRLLLCDRRNGPRLTCGEAGVCADGECALATCVGHDGRTCLDAWTVGECAGGDLVSGTPCPGGCFEDETGTHCEPPPCRDVEGPVCIDDTTLGECADGSLIATAPCDEPCSGTDGEARCGGTSEPELPPDAGRHDADGGVTDAAGIGSDRPAPPPGGCSAIRGGARRNATGSALASVTLLWLTRVARRRGRARTRRMP